MKFINWERKGILIRYTETAPCFIRYGV